MSMNENKNISPQDCQDYIGDGVYWKFDGYHHVLVVDRGYGSEMVALDPHVFKRLVKKQNEVADKAGLKKLEWLK